MADQYQVFEQLCTEYYKSCQYNEPNIKIQYLLTLFDSCIIQTNGYVKLNLVNNAVDLPPPSSTVYTELVEMYLAIGFDSAGYLRNPNDYSKLISIKNDCRRRIHEWGQTYRMDQFYEQLSLTVFEYPKDVVQCVSDFIAKFDSEGSAGFLIGLEKFMFNQSRSKTGVEWITTYHHFTENGVYEFSKYAVPLLKQLRCEYRIDGESVIWRTELNAIECLRIEIELYHVCRKYRKLSAGSGKVVDTEVEVQKDGSWPAYFRYLQLYWYSFWIRSLF